MPSLPHIAAPVGKSGPFTIFIRALISTEGSSITLIMASAISLRLWGAILVAIPTAIPLQPFTRSVGIADGITRKLFEKIDQKALDMNTITGVCPEVGRIPLTLENDREALDIMIRCVGLVATEKLKIMRIKNTSCLSEVDVSEGYAEELNKRNDLAVIRDWYDIEFDENGNLRPF